MPELFSRDGLYSCWIFLHSNVLLMTSICISRSWPSTLRRCILKYNNWTQVAVQARVTPSELFLSFVFVSFLGGLVLKWTSGLRTKPSWCWNMISSTYGSYVFFVGTTGFQVFCFFFECKVTSRCCKDWSFRILVVVLILVSVAISTWRRTCLSVTNQWGDGTGEVTEACWVTSLLLTKWIYCSGTCYNFWFYFFFEQFHLSSFKFSVWLQHEGTFDFKM